jgi:hypothetical protein
MPALRLPGSFSDPPSDESDSEYAPTTIEDAEMTEEVDDEDEDEDEEFEDPDQEADEDDDEEQRALRIALDSQPCASICLLKLRTDDEMLQQRQMQSTLSASRHSFCVLLVTDSCTSFRRSKQQCSPPQCLSSAPFKQPNECSPRSPHLQTRPSGCPHVPELNKGSRRRRRTRRRRRRRRRRRGRILLWLRTHRRIRSAADSPQPKTPEAALRKGRGASTGWCGPRTERRVWQAPGALCGESEEAQAA